MNSPQPKRGGWLWEHFYTALRSARDLFQRPRMSAADRILFFKRMSILLSAGIPVSECLAMAKDQSANARLRDLIDALIRDTQNGKSLSRSLGKFPHVYGAFTLHMISVGEASGTLSQNFEYIAEELRKSRILKQKIVSALLYPGLITAATLVLTGFLILYLFPKLMPIFLSLRMQLPLSTRVIIAVSQFLTQYGLLLIGALIVGAIISTLLRIRVPRVNIALTHALLRAPIGRVLIQNYHLAQSARSLGLLLKSGIPLSPALSLIARMTRNPLYRTEWFAIASAIDRGEKMSERMRRSALLFPPVASQMIAVGERSGHMAATLLYLSDMYEHEFDEYTKSLSSLLEPVLMIFMGFLIGIVAISIITPIYGLTEHLHA